MNNTNKTIYLGLLVSALFTTAALAFPPPPPYHPETHFDNQTTSAIQWHVSGDHGDAVYVSNSPPNPVPAGTINVEFKYYVPWGAGGTQTLTWGAGYTCTFYVGPGGAGGIKTQTTDPNYQCAGRDGNIGIYPTSH
jgi:hypothetical protein